MLLSGPQTPAATSLLPETHVALLHAGRIVRGMEDAWALARAERGQLPRAVNFVSGPSRTADIEQTINLGPTVPNASTFSSSQAPEPRGVWRTPMLWIPGPVPPGRAP